MTTTGAEVRSNPRDGSEHIAEESFIIYLKY